MSKLHVCRLCKREPMLSEDRGSCQCFTDSCFLAWIKFPVDQWNKLMYVPAKKRNPDSCALLDIGRFEGYNQAIDEMEKGGL